VFSNLPKIESAAKMEHVEFERAMIDQMVKEDCLLVSGRGIGIEKLLFQVLRVFNEREVITVVIGCPSSVEEYVLEAFKSCGTADNLVPKIVNFESSISERVKMYDAGGILFITSRILVVDLLVDRIPCDRISGIFYYDAHKVLESHQDSFIIRLFRMKNHTGFVKAFTQDAQSLTRGYGRLDRVMRSLFLKKVSLWSRNNDLITDTLNSHAKPEVTELRFNLTTSMESIQFAIMDLISLCLKEIKFANSTLLEDADEISIENAIDKNFSRFLKRQFDPVWNQLNARTKRVAGPSIDCLENDVGSRGKSFTALSDLNDSSNIEKDVSASIRISTDTVDTRLPCDLPQML